jgi:hypothetical protein
MVACVATANVAITTISAVLTAPATVVELVLLMLLPPVLIAGDEVFILRRMMINYHTWRQSTTGVN